MLRVALVQMPAAYEKARNVEKACTYIRQAADQGAGVVCLPELFNTIYFCVKEDPKYFAWAEPIPGPSTERIAETARRHHLVVIAPIYEQDQVVTGLRYNSAAVIGTQGELLGLYRKNSLPSVKTTTMSGNEKFYFAPGNLGFPVFPTLFGVNLGVVLSYDVHFPEAARCLALNGAHVLFAPSAWASPRAIWDIELKGHAILNLLYVAGVNRVANDERAGSPRWSGGSQFVNPRGEVEARAGDGNEEIIYGDVDLGLIEQVRTETGLYRNRRPDAYGKVLT